MQPITNDVKTQLNVLSSINSLVQRESCQAYMGAVKILSEQTGWLSNPQFAHDILLQLERIPFVFGKMKDEEGADLRSDIITTTSAIYQKILKKDSSERQFIKYKTFKDMEGNEYYIPLKDINIFFKKNKKVTGSIIDIAQLIPPEKAHFITPEIVQLFVEFFSTDQYIYLEKINSDNVLGLTLLADCLEFEDLKAFVSYKMDQLYLRPDNDRDIGHAIQEYVDVYNLNEGSLNYIIKYTQLYQIKSLAIREFKDLEVLTKCLKQVPGITRIDVSKIGDEEFNEIIKLCPHLREMLVSHATITKIPISLKVEKLRILEFKQLKEIIAHDVKNLSIWHCPELTSVETSAAILAVEESPKVISINFTGQNLTIKNCPSLEVLNAPSVKEIQNLTFDYNSPKLKVIGVGENIFIQTLDRYPRSLYPQLRPSMELEKLFSYIYSFEVDTESFQKQVQIAVPDAPRIPLVYTSPISVDVLELSSGDLLELIPVKYTDQSICGKLYTEQELKQGMTNVLNLIIQGNISADLKKELLTVLIRFETEDNNFLTPEQQKLLREKAILRMAVTGINGNLEQVSRDVQLLFLLDRFVDFYAGMNFSESNEPHYIHPDMYKDDNNVSITFAQLRTGAIDLIQNTLLRTPRIGTPPLTPEDDSRLLNQFYYNLEQYLQLTVVNLEKLKDTTERTQYLLDLAIAGIHCGERYIGDSEQIYSLSLPKEEDSQVEDNQSQKTKTDLPQQQRSIGDYMHAHDAMLRIGIVEELAKAYRGNVHAFDHYKRVIGETVGLRGAGSVIGIPDIHTTGLPSKELALAQFMQNYKIKDLLVYHRDYLNSLLKSSQTRDKTILLLKHTITDEWINVHYGEVFNLLEAMESKQMSRTEIRAALVAKGYKFRADWSAASTVATHSAQLKAAHRRALSQMASKEDRKVLKATFAGELEKLADLEREISSLNIEEQKSLLKASGIHLGREYEVNFKDELLVHYVYPDYLDSLFDKDSDGEVLPTISYTATGIALEAIDKIRPKALVE